MLLTAIILMLTIGGSMADPSGGFSEIHGKTRFDSSVEAGNATLETSKKFLKVNAYTLSNSIGKETNFTFTFGGCEVDGVVGKFRTLGVFDFGSGQFLGLPVAVDVYDSNVTFTAASGFSYIHNCTPEFEQNPTGQSNYTINVGVDLEQPITALLLEFEAILERPLTTTTQVTTAITTAANLTSEVSDKAGIIGGSVVGAVFVIALFIALGVFVYCKWWKKSKRKAVEHPIKPAVKHKAPKPDPVKVEKPEPPTPEPPKIEQPKNTLVLASNVVPKQPVESKEPEAPKRAAGWQPEMLGPSKDLVTKPASYEAVANLNGVGPPPNTELTPTSQPPAKSEFTAKSDDSVPTAQGGPPAGKTEEPVDGTQEVTEKKSVEMFP